MRTIITASDPFQTGPLPEPFNLRPGEVDRIEIDGVIDVAAHQPVATLLEKALITTSAHLRHVPRATASNRLANYYPRASPRQGEDEGVQV